MLVVVVVVQTMLCVMPIVAVQFTTTIAHYAKR
jgi:hypothetical protein